MGAVVGGMVPDAEQRPIGGRHPHQGLGGLSADGRSGVTLASRGERLLEAPRIEAPPAPQVNEAIHARGNVDVRARALVARRKGLSQDAPLDGSILGGHDVLGVGHHGIIRLSCQSAGA
jgi:hypothetical protein